MSGKCINCGTTLTMNEVGLYKKMINRMVEEFLCKKCLAERIKCSTEYLDVKIAQFKAQGCLLFDLDD